MMGWWGELLALGTAVAAGWLFFRRASAGREPPVETAGELRRSEAHRFQEINQAKLYAVTAYFQAKGFQLWMEGETRIRDHLLFVRFLYHAASPAVIEICCLPEVDPDLRYFAYTFLGGGGGVFTTSETTGTPVGPRRILRAGPVDTLPGATPGRILAEHRRLVEKRREAGEEPIPMETREFLAFYRRELSG